MIPTICANCEYATNVNSDQGIALSLCGYLPIVIAKQPAERCGCFSMAQNPPIVQTEGTPTVAQDSALDETSEMYSGALDAMMGNPMEQLEEMMFNG